MGLIKNIDLWAAVFAESIRGDFLTLFFKTITYLGEWSFVLIVLFFISLFFAIKKKFRYDIILWLATLGGIGTAFILKEIFHRSRPLNSLVAESSSSFPSAHAAISIVFYAFIFYLLAKNNGKSFSKLLSISAMLIIPVLVGFSRIYLGVHYLSDVLAGYLLGLFWLAAGIYASEKFARINKNRHPMSENF